ncbi:MAG: hypothetical protein L0Y66_00155 [Myxococcaceae bacterium]|nr:hypothetical protein [Myxococcaceae bacterium]
MPVFARRVVLPQDSGPLTGELFVPEKVKGVVVAGHDTVNPTYSAHAESLALELTTWNLAVLLLGLQTGIEEERILAGWGVADSKALERAADRFLDACRFLGQDEQTVDLRVGLFGTGTGAAASFLAGARAPPSVVTVAACGGRPWLAGPAAEALPVPSLLIVGSEDELGLPETVSFSRRLRGETSLRLVPRASRGFTEPGTREDALRICGEWFRERFEVVTTPREYGWTDPLGRWV